MTSEPNPLPPQRRPAYLAWLRLIRVMQRFRRLAEAEVQATGLSGAQLAVLFELLYAEGVTQQVLADSMELTKGNITQLLDKLEIDGLLHRQRGGRKNQVYLTETGHAKAHAYLIEQQQFVEARMSVLTSDEQAQLLALLRKLERNLK